MKLIFLLTGGALGSLSRYLISGYVYRFFTGIFPWGTLVVNVSGAFIIGLLWGLFEIREIPPNTRLFLFVGFLGGYTTFSTFALESMNLIRDGEIKLALVNILASNILTLLFVFAGFFLARVLLTNLK